MKTLRNICIAAAILLGTMAMTVVTPVTEQANVIKVALSGKNFIFKQTLEFSDREPVVIYYMKDGSGYSAWSETNLAKQNPKQLSSLTGFSIEEAKEVKGKCYYKANTLDEAISTGISLYRNYGHFVKL